MQGYRYPEAIIAMFPGLELSADQPTPLAFSKAPLFHKALYCLYAEIRSTKRADYVLYVIGRYDAVSARYDTLAPIYASRCYEDIADVWAIFR